MNYTLHQLQVFLKVVQTGSITRASEELHLTQPAVSIQLKNLQDQFRIPLTEVVGRKIFITEFGHEIAVAAQNIIDQIDTINTRSIAFQGHLTGKLKIAVVSTGIYVMPHFLTDFLKEHPGVELVMEVTNKNMVVNSLEKNETDFALVSIIPNHLRTEKIDLLENRLFLIGNKGSKIKSNLSLKELFEDLPLIFRESGSGTRQTMEKFLDRHHLSVRKKMELTGNEAVKQAVLAGLGYSIMPEIGLKNDLKTGDLRIIPVKGLPIKTNWSIIWLKGKKQGPVAKAFLDHLHRNKVQIKENRFGEMK